MEKSRAWIPANSTEFQFSRRSHRIFIAGGQSHVKRASEHMLAVFGYTKESSSRLRADLTFKPVGWTRRALMHNSENSTEATLLYRQFSEAFMAENDDAV